MYICDKLKLYHRSYCYEPVSTWCTAASAFPHSNDSIARALIHRPDLSTVGPRQARDTFYSYVVCQVIMIIFDTTINFCSNSYFYFFNLPSMSGILGLLQVRWTRKQTGTSE